MHNNLRQIGLAAMLYANTEVRTGSFPRTYYNVNNPKLVLDTTGYGKRDSFDAKAVGENNVTASFYLILDAQDVTPAVFICPSTSAAAGLPKDSKITVLDSSNWEAIPGNITYSYSCPFPAKEAIMNRWIQR